jgi:murein DD-endopeptidase MepM/ murein hydrolase activator NlpD
VVDPNLNALANDRQIDLDVNLNDPNTVQIAVPVPPTGDVTVTVHAANAIANATDSEAPTVYVYSTAGDSGDGEDTFAPVPAMIDASVGTITVSIPGGYFQPTDATTYIATLKIGIAAACTSPAPTAAHAIQRMMPTARNDVTAVTSSTGMSIPCPLAGVTCIERSRFNPVRYLKGVMRPHYGVDFVASIGTNIYVPSGGKPSHAFTETQYTKEIADKGLTCPSKACSRVNDRAGMILVIDYGTQKIKLLHLSSIDPSMLNADGTLNKNTTTSAANPVAKSGNTGAAMLAGAHLHFEVVAGTSPVCAIGTSSCKYVHGRTDPFPFIATQLNFQEASNQTVLQAGATYGFKLSATDSDGFSVSSDVHNAGENFGVPPVFGPQIATFTYDPTRKVCLASSSADVLQFPTPDGNTQFAGIAFAGSSPSYCAPWGTTIAANGLANSPATTVTVKYSADPTRAVALDPLSEASASWTLTTQPAMPDIEITAETATQMAVTLDGVVIKADDESNNLDYINHITVGSHTLSFICDSSPQAICFYGRVGITITFGAVSPTSISGNAKLSPGATQSFTLIVSAQ